MRWTKAEALLALSAKKEERYRAELKQIEDGWGSGLHALGFEPAILPGDLGGWLTKRSAALDAEQESIAAQQALETAKSQIADARTAILVAFTACGGAAMAADDPALVQRATERVAELKEIATNRTRLGIEAKSVEETLAELGDEDKELAKERAELDEGLQRLVFEAGLPQGSDETLMADALEILAQVHDDVGARDSIQRQVSGIEQDRTAFETELVEILASVGIARKGETIDQARQLAASLRDAVRNEEALAAHAIERERLTNELARVRRRLDKAEASIEELMRLAGATTDTELDQMIAGVGRRDAARAIERDALNELAGTDNGAGLDALALEIAALPIEDEAAARARIEDRRREVAAEREVVGPTLNAADDEVARAATESAAADAQQAATRYDRRSRAGSGGAHSSGDSRGTASLDAGSSPRNQSGAAHRARGRFVQAGDRGRVHRTHDRVRE